MEHLYSEVGEPGEGGEALEPQVDGGGVAGLAHVPGDLGRGQGRQEGGQVRQGGRGRRLPEGEVPEAQPEGGGR